MTGLAPLHCLCPHCDAVTTTKQQSPLGRCQPSCLQAKLRLQLLDLSTHRKRPSAKGPISSVGGIRGLKPWRRRHQGGPQAHTTNKTAAEP
jgi:hypothetical protein